MAQRGQITPAIRAKMEAWLGRPTSQVEMRLYPYLLYVMVNNQKIDPTRINAEERAIFQQLKAAGHMEGGMSGLAMTREFWDFAQDIVWDAYVAYGED